MADLCVGRGKKRRGIRAKFGCERVTFDVAAGRHQDRPRSAAEPLGPAAPLAFTDKVGEDRPSALSFQSYGDINPSSWDNLVIGAYVPPRAGG
jgi:hypothetical protein